MIEKIVVAEHHGFCFGVKNAIEKLEEVVEQHDKVYVLNEIVHNSYVVKSFEQKGVIFVEDISKVPDYSVLVFSAHGIAPAVREKATEKKLTVYDTTCPRVQKVHEFAKAYCGKGYSIIYIGKKNHPETLGVLGECPMNLVSSLDDAKTLKIDSENIVCLTQTTLSVEDSKEITDYLKETYSDIIIKNNICTASQKRQDAVKQLAKECDLIIVLGAKNSSNSKRLVETAQKQGTDAYLILDKSELKDVWLKEVKTLGITSGASCPDFLLNELIEALNS